jgi:mono/diheme cytochrome c family protein
MRRQTFVVSVAIVSSFMVAVFMAAPGAAGLGPSAAGVPQAPTSASTSAAPVPHTPAEYRAVVGKYCVSCHNTRLKTGGLELDNIDFTRPADHKEALERAIRKLKTGAMPPQGMPRPDRGTQDALVTWMSTELDRAAVATPNPGRAILRRLNRTEYANAIRDLLDLDIDVASLLPVDNSSYGFDNIADVLGVSPVLLERYLTAARRISAVAVGDTAVIPLTTETFRARPDLSQDVRLEGFPLGTRGGLSIKYTFPLDAQYTFKVFPMLTTVSNIRGLQDAHEIIVLVDGSEVARKSIGGPEDYQKSMTNATMTLNEVLTRLTFRVPVKAGPHTVTVTFVEQGKILESATLQPYKKIVWDTVSYLGIPHIERLTVTGPYDATGPGDTPSRRRIFSCHPTARAEEAACAAKILSTLARRAYRRTITPADVDSSIEFFKVGRAKGSFDSGIELGLRRILASPNFVFRAERDPSSLQPGAVHPVSDVELASRLSFFLWSSLPDETLLRLAEQGRLREPDVLAAQIRRMIADSRASALVDNFAGQWLYLRNISAFAPDPYTFPDFDHGLRVAMRREMELFFDYIVRADRSVIELMTADYTFVNERLARHYGIQNVFGSEFRRVTLTQDERRGLLGKGAILAVTSRPNRTSPVLRGKWVLENIVGTPPPPPPPEVPALEENTMGQKPKTMRGRLEAHRVNQPCAGCHRLMDPIGFAMDKFDAVGAWHDRDAGAPIDSSGVLSNGARIDGPSGLREALVADPTIFVTTMTEKMMTYALGRGLTASDMPAVRKIVNESASKGYRFSALTSGIVASVPFQMRLKGEDQLSTANATP